MNATRHPACDVAELYRRHRALARSTVSRLAAGRGDTLDALAAGRVTIRRADRILRWLSDHWPADLPWPTDIPRPAPSPDSPAAEAAAQPPPLTERERALAAALEIGSHGRVRSPRALCEALRVNRTTFDDVIRRYSDFGPQADHEPLREKSGVVSWTQRLLDALVESGDCRFNARRERRRRHAELAQRFGLGGTA